MKRTFILLLCLALAVAPIAGCAQSQTPPAEASPAQADSPAEEAAEDVPAEEPAQGGGLERIKAKGTLILATESTYPPFQYLIVENGNTINAGLDVDIMRGFAESIGVELVVHEMAFDSIIPAVQAGTADCGGSFTPTPERAEVIDFSALYYYNNHTIIVRKGEAGQYANLEAFHGEKLGAQKGTVQEQMIDAIPEITALGLPKVTSLIQELITGNIGGIMVDRATADTYVAAYPDQVEKATFEIPDDSGGVAMLVAKGQPDLLEAMDAYILAGMENGEIEALYDKNLNAAIDQILEAME